MAGDGRNRLAEERSPFLQHGATQPVDWHPWGEEAFERARAENRPVLLDIGAVWCHWCHVMDRESYEDPETAALINELFVPVKVDRDERPDIDARYQRAVQLMTGQGGWPLTAVLTGNGEVFYGGTYFPPEDMPGRPAFRRVLREVARVWREEPERAAGAATQIRTRLQELAEGEAQPGEPRATLLDGALEELADSFDFRHGGFGRAPKFPHAGGLDLLLDEWADRETPWARRIVVETLGAMAKGGIHDQLGGGFHRYSTDPRWLVPHFEKMAYDNGALLETFARAAAAFGDGGLAGVAAGIVSHYRDVAPALLDAGGFPASQDADVGDDDGDYWTWTEAEVRAALSDDGLAEAALLHFGFDDRGARMHLDPDRHVLFHARSAAEVAGRLGIDAAAAADRLERASALLKNTRDQRPRPYVDETLYTGWVAMVASGFLAADRYAGVAGAREDAVRALGRIWRDTWQEERGLAHTSPDPRVVMLEDQSLAALALLDAWEVTQEPVWLERAASVTETMLRRFATPGGALADRPNDAGREGMLGTPHLPIADAPSPSGNGAAALALQRLHAVTGERRWADGASGILRAFAGSAARLSSSAATYMKALAWSTKSVTTLVIVGDGEDAASRALLETALRTFRPRTVVRRIAPGQEAAGLPMEVRAMLTGEAPRAYVCAGRSCAAPVGDGTSLETLLRTFRG